MATFHVVSELLTRCSHRTPMRLTATKKNISRTATRMPTPWTVPLLENQLCAQWAVDRYWIAASTSIGATLAAWM